ncbi:hypothetical protein IWZ03DRAFT_402526 [Phyllosticta citriasiana]|uniref:ATPase AAA-type core domain-containing protein n=1 Tax=Phyllosticta citriasiana TaxID=595635 RepID=A0ABR1KZ74_9PEZI
MISPRTNIFTGLTPNKFKSSEGDSEDNGLDGNKYMEGDWTEEDDETSVAQERLASPVNLQGKSSLLERHYDLCPPTVEGFCLKAKDWGYLDVEDIHDIDWNTTAFDKLVLPHAYRRLVWAWMNAQLSQSDDIDDVIKGKGKGIIMLLSGELGTGKTLTSEYISEAMKKPLYSTSAGELGDDTSQVERKLGQGSETAGKWRHTFDQVE